MCGVRIDNIPTRRRSYVECAKQCPIVPHSFPLTVCPVSVPSLVYIRILAWAHGRRGSDLPTILIDQQWVVKKRPENWYANVEPARTAIIIYLYYNIMYLLVYHIRRIGTRSAANGCNTAPCTVPSHVKYCIVVDSYIVHTLCRFV